MRHLAKPKITPFFWTGITRPVKLGLGILLLGLAGPALGGREAPAVWVPLDAKQPFVMVPFQDPLYVPDPGQGPVPWTPDYLVAPGPGLLDGAVWSGLLPRDVRRDEAGPRNRRGTVPGSARPFTLSDVLRDVDWRRQTAERLRQSPDFKPRF